MWRSTGFLMLGLCILMALGVAPAAYGMCNGSRPVLQAFSNLSDCPDAFRVAGFIAVVGHADTVNSNGIGPICSDGTAYQGDLTPCSPDAGSPGDGVVMIQFDWSNMDWSTDPRTLPLGCANPDGLPGIDRVFIQVVCNDGAGALLTTDYYIGWAGYDFDFPARVDPVTGDYTLHLSAASNGLHLVSATRSQGTDTVCISQTGPVPVYSDCDPESLARQFGAGCDTPTPAVAHGETLYVKMGPATPPPTDLRVAGWSQAPTTAGPEGSRCFSYPTPAAGICSFVGSTAVVAGQDSGAIAGWIRTCDIAEATDTLTLDAADLSHGKLTVRWSTGNETLITGFNVWAESTKLNDAPIPAKGSGSQSYLYEIGRGALKSVRAVLVEALKSDGTIERTPAVSLK